MRVHLLYLHACNLLMHIRIHIIKSYSHVDAAATDLITFGLQVSKRGITSVWFPPLSTYTR
jgi:hypothetical protein